MQVRVELPVGPLIEYLKFCHAIAEAVCPTSERYYQGIECIVNKMVTHHLPMAQSAENEKGTPPVEFQAVLLSEGGRRLDQLLPDRPDAHEMSALELPLEPGLSRRVVELSMPYRLDENDRRALQKILPTLPPLRYPISDADQAAFRDAWFSLKDRPTWEPVLVTTEYIQRRKDEQSTVLAKQQEALQKEFKGGRLEALDGHYVPVTVLMAGCFISRQQAIAYLERRGFSYVSAELVAGAEAKNGPAAPEAERKRESKRASVGPRMREKQSPANPRGEEGDGTGARKIESTGSESSGNGASQASANNSGVTAGKVARLQRVKELTGLGRSSIYNRMDERSKHYDSTFPRSFKLGSGEAGATGWDEDAVKSWVAAQAVARPK
ncbi:MAG: AlpA family phage regulatory protein [Paraburkholderia tropica]|uniref:AlpA family transcriptional regulator n=1 Tax=Paraburkholderia tropica TaxID=92647 RepID=A0ABX5MR05_9BURK|nr:AlpA family phage regulatory protein [Paraburkholderia tropica]PXX13917.1 AlpA family transcriptional regulator [Paraburkholderia tropica]PZW78100.1 AlpA family transcriptional regulator [Paraburkholderia tropica]